MEDVGASDVEETGLFDTKFGKSAPPKSLP